MYVQNNFDLFFIFINLYFVGKKNVLLLARSYTFSLDDTYIRLNITYRAQVSSPVMLS